ncbi:vWA domain-containing protein [Konateibacter massiliensis]|uniref:vWA domain-containing protein n=1 Tax=Konateibacter massiliensis TaxID=2002841 RepID=UPI000C146F05|nr:VWA-like domain-containing protein [Konateibacter massiliensis]
MEQNLERQAAKLRGEVERLLGLFSHPAADATKFKIDVPEDFKRDFFSLIDKVNASLMEEKEDFYGYFLFQMEREIRFDINSPTGTNFSGAKYIICFNPAIFLKLNLKQMASSIKHEILHILSLHLIRAREMRGVYSKLAVNMAMDIVVNKYLSNLPSYATTLEWVNKKYSLTLKPYETFEYYAAKLQEVLALKNEEKDNEDEETKPYAATLYDPELTHDIWEESDEADAQTMADFTKKAVDISQKGGIPDYLETLIASLTHTDEELPWNLYLSRLMGMVESNKKKTVTRRNRRQPDRLDLRGELRNHKANIIVAIDISGSISEEEFQKAMSEIIHIVKNYGHETTVIECDDEIRRIYKIRSERDLRDRLDTKGGTRFTPVFEYANQSKVNLLIYFTDGKGEDRLKVVPHGYHVLWVISGKGENLSLKEPYGAVKKLKTVSKVRPILDETDVERGGYSMNNQER